MKHQRTGRPRKFAFKVSVTASEYIALALFGRAQRSDMTLRQVSIDKKGYRRPMTQAQTAVRSLVSDSLPFELESVMGVPIEDIQRRVKAEAKRCSLDEALERVYAAIVSEFDAKHGLEAH